MPELSALAKRVKAYRKKTKKSQFELSGEIGISLEELSLIERESANPTLSTMQKIAACMGITVSELLEVEER
ncbi:MAG: helix-turn-helix transcriptional regulator [Lawsonibacter sp.]|nr:helix-turn-helix transcriptional regulator [Lawsonibacter sp.]